MCSVPRLYPRRLTLVLSRSELSARAGRSKVASSGIEPELGRLNWDLTIRTGPVDDWWVDASRTVRWRYLTRGSTRRASHWLPLEVSPMAGHRGGASRVRRTPGST